MCPPTPRVVQHWHRCSDSLESLLPRRRPCIKTSLWAVWYSFKVILQWARGWTRDPQSFVPIEVLLWVYDSSQYTLKWSRRGFFQHCQALGPATEIEQTSHGWKRGKKDKLRLTGAVRPPLHNSHLLNCIQSTPELKGVQENKRKSKIVANRPVENHSYRGKSGKRERSKAESKLARHLQCSTDRQAPATSALLSPDSSGQQSHHAKDASQPWAPQHQAAVSNEPVCQVWSQTLPQWKMRNLPAGEKTGLEVVFGTKDATLTISLSSSKTSGSLVLSQRRRDLSWDADTT